MLYQNKPVSYHAWQFERPEDITPDIQKLSLPTWVLALCLNDELFFNRDGTRLHFRDVVLQNGDWLLMSTTDENVIITCAGTAFASHFEPVKPSTTVI